MQLRLALGLLLAIGAPTASLFAQVDGEQRTPASDPRILLDYATFDPLAGAPEVPAVLRSGADTKLWIVQFHYVPTDHDRQIVLDNGGVLHSYLPHNAYVVRMGAGTAAAVAVQPEVRWVGAYEPAYRLEPELRNALASGSPLAEARYNMVMSDKRRDKQALEQKIVALGGRVHDRHEGGLLFTAELDGAELAAAARLDEVLWIDRWTAPGEDMNNARTVQGSDYIEAQAGYTGSGVRGHVYEGVEATHPDFSTAMTNVLSSGAAQAHGHCTAGCIFGNGNSAPQARGHAPDARGYYTTYTAVNAGVSRNQVIDAVVNTHNCMFTTASWGGGVTTAYTSVSADADDIVFDHRIPWTNSMSNQGNQNVRPEAWAKNVISVGGLFPFNDADPTNDDWSYAGQPFSSASIGPAADGRLKPDLCNFYDDVWTSDLSGASGYSAGNSTTGFNGTSAATPITAGLNALAIQMYTDHIFSNAPRVASGTRFQNRPYAQTLKALQIACSSLYPISQATRAQAGWGYGNVRTMYSRRNRITIIPEDRPIAQGNTHTYPVNVLSGESSLRVVMSYLDPAGNPAAAIDRINDLTLRVIHPNGTTAYWGNVGLTSNNTSSTGGSANTIDTVECVFVNNPAAGVWTVQITAPTIAQDAHTATAGVDATYALVVNGGRYYGGSGCARYIPDSGTTGNENVIPFGSSTPRSLTTTFTSNNGLSAAGSVVYYDLTLNQNTHWIGLDINTAATVGNAQIVDVYTRSGTYVGNTGSSTGWTHRSTGHGVAAGQDAPTRIFFNEPPFLGPGTYGVAVVNRTAGHRYTNGNGSNQAYSNADLSLSLGASAGSLFSGSVITPRVANTAILYRLDDDTWVNQKYQTLVKREDLGNAGTINGLAFSSTSTGRHFNRELVIRMSHVPAGHTMSTTFATNMPTPVTVLDRWDYTWHVNADQWTEIGLSTPFNYNGTSDVVVEIFTRGNTVTDGDSFNGFNTGAVERLYAYGFLFNAVPATGTLGSSAGLRMRVNFNCAVSTEFGTSCGYLNADTFGTPNRGGVAWYDLYDALPSSGVVLGLGFTPYAPFSQSLNSFGLTGCHSDFSLATSLFKITGTTGFTTHSIVVPNDPSFDGLQIHGQWFALDPTQAGGITVSNSITCLIGIDP